MHYYRLSSFFIFTQPTNAIDVNRGTLSHLNSINAIGVIICHLGDFLGTSSSSSSLSFLLSLSPDILLLLIDPVLLNYFYISLFGVMYQGFEV